jgi:hypothetical protein
MLGILSEETMIEFLSVNEGMVLKESVCFLNAVFRMFLFQDIIQTIAISSNQDNFQGFLIKLTKEC